MIVALLILAFALACGVVSVVHMFRKEWGLAVLFALPALYVLVAVAVESARSKAIREARQKAIERGDIPAEDGVRK